jgi:cell division protein FtsB
LRENSPADVTIIFQALGAMKVPFVRFTYIVAFLLVAGYAIATLRGPKGVPALVERQRQIEQAEKRNADLARQIERQRDHIQRLANSPAEQELEIRERLKLVHPNEKVFITGQPDNTEKR